MKPGPCLAAGACFSTDNFPDGNYANATETSTAAPYDSPGSDSDREDERPGMHLLGDDTAKCVPARQQLTPRAAAAGAVCTCAHEPNAPTRKKLFHKMI